MMSKYARMWDQHQMKNFVERLCIFLSFSKIIFSRNVISTEAAKMSIGKEKNWADARFERNLASHARVGDVHCSCFWERKGSKLCVQFCPLKKLTVDDSNFIQSMRAYISFLQKYKYFWFCKWILAYLKSR